MENPEEGTDATFLEWAGDYPQRWALLPLERREAWLDHLVARIQASDNDEQRAVYWRLAYVIACAPNTPKPCSASRHQARAVRIMVTVPSEAAHEYALVRDLLLQGMDCMRINCAHDDAATWLRITEHLRQADRLQKNVTRAGNTRP